MEMERGTEREGQREREREEHANDKDWRGCLTERGVLHHLLDLGHGVRVLHVLLTPHHATPHRKDDEIPRETSGEARSGHTGVYYCFGEEVGEAGRNQCNEERRLPISSPPTSNGVMRALACQKG